MLRWLVVYLVAATGLLVSPAHAWVEISVRSSATTVAVAETGGATVSHEWLLRVKGGPLRTITIEGVDSDATLMDGATLVRASSGQVAGVPVALTGQREGQTLHLEVAYNKGLPAGAYLLRFAYATNLQERGLIRAAGARAAVEWQSPVYRDGIDSLKVRFIFAHAPVAPHLEQAADTELSRKQDKVQVVSTDSGVFLSEVQREADSDVLTLTRPHVARQERVTWRMLVSPSSVGLTATTSTASSPPPSGAYVPPQQRLWPYAVTLSFAAVFVLVLFFKLRTGEFAPLVGMKRRYRLPLTFALVSASLWCALVQEWPSVAACLLFTACVLALTRAEYEPSAARGPGEWRAVSPSTLPYVPPRQAAGSRWLDVGAIPGLLVFLTFTGGTALVGLRMIGVSPYISATALFYAMAFVPLFFTVGGKRRLSPVGEQLLFLGPLEKRLAPAIGSVEFIGRFPTGAERPDEVRLQVRPVAPRAGFRSCQVALECTQGAFGRILTPAILVRVDDRSDAYQSLPRDGQWSRGRHTEERVVVLRPRLPLRSVTVDLLTSVVKQISRSRPTRSSAAESPTKLRAPASARL